MSRYYKGQRSLDDCMECQGIVQREPVSGSKAYCKYCHIDWCAVLYADEATFLWEDRPSNRKRADNIDEDVIRGER